VELFWPRVASMLVKTRVEFDMGGDSVPALQVLNRTLLYSVKVRACVFLHESKWVLNGRF
jgi:hypothetical protein